MSSSQKSLLALFTFCLLSLNQVFAQTVEFHIRAGTHDKDWNTKETMLTVTVGDTLKLVNDDSIGHAVHSDGDAPFKHTRLIKPNGGTYNAKILGAYDSTKSGPLHDHEFENSSFWVKALAVGEVTDLNGAVAVNEILASYTTVHDPLVVDDLKKAQVASKSLLDLSTSWLAENPNHSQSKNVIKIQTGAKAFVEAEDIDSARVQFITISQGIIELIRSDAELKTKWQLFFCPMVAKKLGFWVQPKAEELANPYMGSTMPGCGSKKPW